MEIKVEKLTDYRLALKACGVTLGKEMGSINMHDLYRSEHSPLRTQTFWVDMIGIPSFVSVHLVRHSIGVDHYVQSKRDDTGRSGKRGKEVTDRKTPVNHSMHINAQALLNMSRVRLCAKASAETRVVMREIKEKISHVDPILYPLMVPKCLYLGRCTEPQSCGADIVTVQERKV